MTVVGSPIEVVVIDYPRLLLKEAKKLIGNEQFGISIVVAHMACEVAVQRALSNGFDKRNITDLEESVSAYFNGYNLGNGRLRGFYSALTGDAIQNEQFWQAFKESAERRNQIIHKGRTATATEATASYEAAMAFVEHIAPQP